MKTKILALYLLATLTLTACTEKEPPTIDGNESSQVASNSSETKSNDSEESSSNNGMPSQENENSNDESSTSEDGGEVLQTTGGNTEFPQEILDYCKDNTVEVKIESDDIYSIYLDGVQKTSPVGAILDLTDEEDPKILYHHPENAKSEIFQKSEGMSGYGMLGAVYVVKFNEDNTINEFFKWEAEDASNVEDTPLYFYAKLHEQL